MNKENKRILDSFTSKNWYKTGLVYGVLLGVASELLLWWKTNATIPLEKLPAKVIIYVLGGLLYGFVMKKYFDWRAKKEKA
jgi:hypothetical protein